MVHFQLKGQLLKVGLVYSPTCQRHHDKEETAMYVLCECNGLAQLSQSPGNQLHEIYYYYYYYYINGIIFYQWTLYTSDVKESSLLNSFFYVILNHLPDDGQQTGRNM